MNDFMAWSILGTVITADHLDRITNPQDESLHYGYTPEGLMISLIGPRGHACSDNDDAVFDTDGAMCGGHAGSCRRMRVCETIKSG